MCALPNPYLFIFVYLLPFRHLSRKLTFKSSKFPLIRGDVISVPMYAIRLTYSPASALLKPSLPLYPTLPVSPVFALDKSTHKSIIKFCISFNSVKV